MQFESNQVELIDRIQWLVLDFREFRKFQNFEKLESLQIAMKLFVTAGSLKSSGLLACCGPMKIITNRYPSSLQIIEK